MYKGSCLCKAITFELKSEPKVVSHCHCNMCQKQHGAAFATYASLKKAEFNYLSGQDKLTTYNSSGDIIRKFCSMCGSNMEWSDSHQYPEWISIAVATLDTSFNPNSISNIHLESKACWLEDLD